MKNFKKRTIALVLASVVTVAGSFAANNYKNGLMALNFGTTGNGDINLSVETKTAYSGNVTPFRRDANTYVLTLSEMKSYINNAPDIAAVSSDIASVEIKTLPYTNSAKGYTRVIIKTHNPINIKAENKIFIPTNSEPVKKITTNATPENLNNNSDIITKNRNYSDIKQETSNQQRIENYSEDISEQNRQIDEYSQEEISNEQNVSNNDVISSSDESYTNTTTSEEKEPFESFLVVLAVLALFGIIAFIAVRASNKMHEVAGEKFRIDVSDEEENPRPKESKRKKIKNTIKQLDAAYSKTAVPQIKSFSQVSTEKNKPVEELNVVDLDELYKESQEKIKENIVLDVDNIEVDENDALAEFLNGFGFEEVEEPKIEELTYDEDFYEKVIKNNSLKFSQDDINCMKELLGLEISKDTMDNISDYAIATPIEPVKPSKDKILENFLLSYKLSQDVSFSQDDITILKDLMNVELDKDFVTNLKTNPIRTKEMQQEIEAGKNKPKKPSEILTLQVKDLLPDLSEALRKQGGKKIESEVKPITVYATEGYEVSTLSLDTQLPDLSKEIDNEEAYISKPSAEWAIVDNSYEVEKFSMVDDLPDLKEALKDPDKYNAPKEENVEVDEEALLKNITNVQFKPFYDGSEEFEILNDFETPSVDDIQNEFNQFGNFEISQEEPIEPPKQTEYDDFEAIYNNDYVDLDNLNKENKEETPKKEVIAKPIQKKIEEKIVEIHKPISNDTRSQTELSETMKKKIQETKAERMARREQILKQRKQDFKVPKEEKHLAQNKQTEIKCIIDNITYTVISTANFTNDSGCYLAKTNNGYAVLGFINNKFIKLREFEKLKSERIMARLNEKLSNGTSRYIVRIGMEKFIVNLTDDNIEYVMSLS